MRALRIASERSGRTRASSRRRPTSPASRPKWRCCARSTTPVSPHATKLWVVDQDGAAWVRVARPERRWFQRLEANPRIEITREGSDAGSDREAGPIAAGARGDRRRLPRPLRARRLVVRRVAPQQSDSGATRSGVRRMNAAPLEFWFEFASTYSYPAALRIEVARAQCRRSARVAALPARSDLRCAGLERLALQSLPGEGSLHVARPGTHLRGTRCSVPQAVGVSAQRAARRARGVSLRGRSLVSRIRARRLPRELRRGSRDRGRGSRRRVSGKRRTARDRRASKRRSRRRARRCCARKATAPSRWDSSARRPSPSATNSSGATTASKRRSRGGNGKRLRGMRAAERR